MTKEQAARLAPAARALEAVYGTACPEAALSLALERGRREMAEGVRAGWRPVSCADFSEAHEHCDANGLAGLCAGPFWEDEDRPEAFDSFAMAVQAGLDRWLREGGLARLFARV